MKKQNPITRLGQYGTNGGPGRPKGSRNKFTRIKEEIVEVWEEENGKEKFRQLFTKDFLKALDRIIAILPKEPLVALEQSPPVEINYVWKSGLKKSGEVEKAPV